MNTGKMITIPPEIVLLVTGTRDIASITRQTKVIYELQDLICRTIVTAVFHGDAPGVDKWCESFFKSIIDPDCVFSYPAKWKLYYKLAGPIRNKEMMDAAIDYSKIMEIPLWYYAFPAPESIGTRHMIKIMKKAVLKGDILGGDIFEFGGYSLDG